MNAVTAEQKIYYTLRIASAMCFIGHGAFGIITKTIWCNYFAVFGIGHDMAYQLMPILGFVDILMGLSLLFYPTRVVLIWLIVWGLITAALRPLSGEPIAEFLERAGNFGAPLVLLLLCNTQKNVSYGFQLTKPSSTVSKRRMNQLQACLKLIVFLLLAGHGWLNLIGKKSLLGQYTSLGFSNVYLVSHIAGLIEIGMALLVLVKPLRQLLLIFLVWKICTELFYPHDEVFEWIERGGSYGTLLALWLTLDSSGSVNRKKEYKITIVSD